MDEELNMKFGIFERQIIQIQKELQAIEQAILDMNQISFGLDEIEGKEGNEILASIGRGIFIKAKISSDEPLVDVGEGNFVKKTIPETKKLIDEQVKKLDKMKNDLENELDKIGKEITSAMEKQNKHGHNHDHEHGKDCECENGEECTDECECAHKH
ncbi:MAG: prefoldin subunit alpha [archaeon]|nr:prefoldin subunit alpha [archaeon]